MSTPATARGATIERYGRDRGYGAYAASDPGVAFARAGRQHNRINRLNGERLCLHPPQRTKAAHPHQSISRRSRPASRAPGLPATMRSSAPPCRSSARSSAKLSTSARERRCSMRSEEHTSELQSLMRISYAVFCLKKKKTTDTITVCNEIIYADNNESDVSK